MSAASTTVRSTFPGNFWQAPLVWVAAAWTLGIALDRYLSLDVSLCCAGMALCLGLWLCVVRAGSVSDGPHRAGSVSDGPHVSKAWSAVLLGAGILFPGLALVQAGAVHHHLLSHRIAADDVGTLVSDEPRPVKIKGTIHSESALVPVDRDPLRFVPAQDAVHFVLAVDETDLPGDWSRMSGLVQVTVPGRDLNRHVGDRVNVIGNLARPESRANPSDFDYEAHLRNQGIATVLHAKAPTAVTLEEKGWQTSLRGWLGAIRAWGRHVLEEALPADQLGVAQAFLLGDTSATTAQDWDRYMRTGVVHVLVVSGQHLVVLAGFLEILLRLARIRRRPRAVLITALLIGYALLTGGRPPVARGAWMVAAACCGILWQRHVLIANTYALAWMGVLLVYPAEIFVTGFQLSFLAVFVLIWGTSLWKGSEPDPLAHAKREARPWVLNMLLDLLCWPMLLLFGVNLLVWIALEPLRAMHTHVLSPAALVVSVPVLLCMSLALVMGYLLLLSALLMPPLVPVFAWLMHLFLAACDFTVNLGLKIPYGHIFVPDLPEWWVGLFYAGLIPALTIPFLRRHWKWSLACALTWALVSCWIFWGPRTTGEFRVTFLAVGHGGCTVIETSGGRVVLYDAGSMTGPEVTRQHIAPFLWRQGYARIDEVMLSHADADHFNGLPSLLECFAVRQITLTPTFAERPTRPVKITLDAIERSRVPVRQVQRGDRWAMDDVSFEVLHPPAQGPPGDENARCLVVRVEHGGHALLLTGDLEDPGLGQVLELPAGRIDVLMAPHHGAVKPNTAGLARWARPQVVISSQSRPVGGNQKVTPYEKVLNVPFLGTWPHGAVTIREFHGAWRVETFRTKCVFDIR